MEEEHINSRKDGKYIKKEWDARSGQRRGVTWSDAQDRAMEVSGPVKMTEKKREERRMKRIIENLYLHPLRYCCFIGGGGGGGELYHQLRIVISPPSPSSPPPPTLSSASYLKHLPSLFPCINSPPTLASSCAPQPLPSLSLWSLFLDAAGGRGEADNS